MLVFATPKFCQTQTCGPTLEKVKAVAEAHPDMTFINVEPYLLEEVDGQLQPDLDANGMLQAAPATDAYGLLVEPFVFVVDGDGRRQRLVRADLHPRGDRGGDRRGQLGAGPSSRRTATRSPSSSTYVTSTGYASAMCTPR